MKREKNSNCYDDIINLPHHVSALRPHMPLSDRAAQFSPFAALTGYESAVKETARLTDRKLEIDEDTREILNKKLSSAMKDAAKRPVLSITYFIADKDKEGGRYVTAEGVIKKMDDCDKLLVLADGTRIHLDDIIDIDFLFNASTII